MRREVANLGSLADDSGTFTSVDSLGDATARKTVDDALDSLGCSDTAGVATSVAADGSNYSAVKIFPQEKRGEKKEKRPVF